MKDLIEFLAQRLAADAKLWLSSLLRPVGTCDRLLTRTWGRDAKLLVALRLFMFQQCLALVVNIPGYAITGVAWADVGFAAGFIVLSLSAVLLSTALEFPMLRLFRQRPPFDAVLLVNAIFMAPLPLLSLQLLPFWLLAPNNLREAKARGGLSLFTGSSSEPSSAGTDTVGLTLALFTMVFTIATFIWAEVVTVLIARVMAQHYDTDEYRYISAINLGFCIFGPLILAIGFGEMALQLAFVR